MTKKELQDYYNINSLCFIEYDVMQTQTYFYERESSYWKKHWKKTRSVMKRYKCKLIHHGDFSEFMGSYSDSLNKIKIMPPAVFVQIEDNEFTGICNYYKTLWHEIFHCIIHHEFHVNMLLKYEAEEMIVEEAVRDIVLNDICTEYYQYLNNKGDLVNVRNKFKKECDEYIEVYRKKLLYDEKDKKQFEIYKCHIINKLKEIYNKCK